MTPVAYREAQEPNTVQRESPTRALRQQGGLTKAFVLIALVALAIRLTFFIGYQGRDDRNYLAYAHHVASGQTIASLDVQTQWVGRVGFWLPLAASISVLGSTEYAYVLFPLSLSIAGVWITLAIGTATVGRRAAVLAALLLAILPLDVLYATRAYPDLPLGVLMVGAFWLALRARDEHQPWWIASAAGFVLGAAYLQKETALFAAVPIGIALRFWSRRHWQALLLIGLSVCVVVAAEFAFWQTVKGDPLYRFHAADAALTAVMDRLDESPAQGWVPGPKPTEMYRSSNSLLDAALMLAVNEELGLLYWLALPLFFIGLVRKDAPTRDLRMWIGLLLLLILFFPVHWPRYTMPRDPRYLTCLAIPSLLLCASYLLRMGVRARAITLMLLITSSAAGVYLGSVSSVMEPQRTLLERARTGEHLWVTPQFGADLLFLNGDHQPIPLGIHFLEQGPTAGSFHAARLVRPTIAVAHSAEEMTTGTLVIRDADRRPPPGWEVFETITVASPKLIAGVQAVLGAAGLQKFALRLAPGGGVTATLYRRSVARGN